MEQKKRPMKGIKYQPNKSRIDPLKTKVECCTLHDGRMGEIHYIPRLNLTIGIDPEDERLPIYMIVKHDDSLIFNRTPAGSVATIKTRTGEIMFSMTGLHLTDTMRKKTRSRIIPWTDSRGIADVVGTLTYRDEIFQSAVTFVPGGIITAFDACGLHREAVDLVRDLPATVKDCWEENIAAVTETVNRRAECMEEGWDDYRACNNRCGRKKWWKRPTCYAGCGWDLATDEAWCVAHGIIEIIVEAAKTIEHCIIKRGLVDGPPSSGDILLFEADSLVGHAIDMATCCYGYSHAGLVCGSNIIEATSEGVIDHPLAEVQDRDHVIIRPGLTDQQIDDLCKCVRAQREEDYDYIEGATFGTIDDNGREICTMLIMHCLDQIGFDRSAIGLGGFVSPNDIARTFDVPHGHLI